MFRKLLLHNIHIGDQHLDNGLGESLHVSLHDFRIRTLQLGYDVETLSKLCEDVHHRVGEQGVLRAPLELKMRGSKS